MTAINSNYISKKKSKSRLAFFCASSLLLLLLTGCGFHLKGVQNTGGGTKIGKTVFPVYEDVSIEFRQMFQQILHEKARLATPVETAEMRIVFLKETCRRRSLTVTDRGIPAEYRLTCTLSYYVAENKPDVPQKSRELSDSSDFKSNNAQLLALESQQTLIKSQILQRIARFIIRDLP